MYIPPELTALLSSNMSRVLEDYDASLCKELYSDDALPHISSSRSDAVSNITYVQHDVLCGLDLKCSSFQFLS